MAGVIRPSRARQWLVAGGSGLCVLLLAVANLVWWAEDPGFRSVNPNPYFLLICVAAAWHGRFGGVLTAIFSIMVCVTLLSVTKTLLLYDILHCPECRVLGAGFLIAALLLGTIADSFKSRYDRLKLLHQETLHRFKDFDCGYQLLEHSKDELEQRVVELANSFTTIFDDAKNLFGLSYRKLLLELLHLLCKYAGAEQIAAYSVRERGFRLEVEFGHTELLPTAIFTDEHPILAEVLATKKMITIRDALARSEGELARCGTIVAVPLIKEDGTLGTVIMIDVIPFMKFNEYTLNVVALLCEWASSVLQQHERLAHLEERQLYDPLLGIYREKYFRERLEEEIHRAQRYRLPLTALVLELDEEPGFEAVVKYLNDEMRQVDVMSVTDAGDRILILLPMTSRDGAEVAVNRIKKRSAARVGVELACRVEDLSECDKDDAIRALEGVPA